jgi:hypothetical protein
MNILKIKKSLITIFFAMFLLGLVTIPSVATSDQLVNAPITVRRPDGTLQDQLHRNLLWLIRSMESADFTPDNVYYGVYNSVGSYSYDIEGSREHNLSVDLTRLTYELNKTVVKMKIISSTDPQKIASLAYLQALLLELQAHNTIKIHYAVDSNLKITSTHDRKAVSIFYDKDRSVLDAFDLIADNLTITSQPFTGDEILTNVFMSLVSDEVSGFYNVTNQWIYEDESDGTYLKRFIERLMTREWLTSELGFLFNLKTVNIMRILAGPETQGLSATPAEPMKLERGTFSISQLKIDTLDLNKVGNNLFVKEYDYTYLEHHLLGTLVYNDTNDNGYMDVGVRTAPVGTMDIAYPTIGDEALYRFDVKGIGNREYSAPVTSNNVLEFGSNFTHVKGNLLPLESNQDFSLFNVTTEDHIVDEISTLFHFEVNNDEGSIALKFDYVIGEWDKSPELEGLGLNQLMASTVVDAQKARTIQWRDENNDELNEEFENSSKISRFRFSDSNSEFAEIRLDDIPYLWDQTETINAVGQLIPMNLIDMTYGTISSEADLIRSMRRSTTRKTFLYSISYPKWDGKEIVHDPTFAVVSGTASENTDTEGIIPGFEFASLLLALPLIAITMRRKRR